MNNISETPEKWVIVKIDNKGYKVFGSWVGGYLGSDRWKLNSGIKSVELKDDFYYITGYSGSIYKCHKNSYGIASSYSRAVLSSLIDKAKISGINIEEITKEDFKKIEWIII